MWNVGTEYGKRCSGLDWAIEELDIQQAQNELSKMTSWKVAYSNKSITLQSVNDWLNLNTWMYCQATTEEELIKEEWEPALLNILEAGVSQKKYIVCHDYKR